jgi:hypothetical protein
MIYSSSILLKNIKWNIRDIHRLEKVKKVFFNLINNNNNFYKLKYLYKDQKLFHENLNHLNLIENAKFQIVIEELLLTF